MRRAASLARTFAPFVVWTVVGLLPVMVWARGEPEPEQPPPADNYVLAYFITFLGVALGLVSVCLSAFRRDEIKATLD